MAPNRWQQLESIYGDVVDLPAPQRAAFLDRACGGDTGLRREVEAMLGEASADRSLHVEQRLLVDARAGETGDSQPPADGLVGRRIGAWRIVRRIGQGGMATVYLADREDSQFQQRVAIKIGRPAFDAADASARFRMERQILANLVHPHIARLLDGGVTDEGQAYIVMEYVEGQTITAYCDTKALPITSRLRLFQVVCRAVQHAHSHLIVHRDLKPANILVSAGGDVKLLDFGIAKLLDPGAIGVDAVATRDSVRPMTLEYAAPEQIAGGPITTATDVHALGVVWYELLTGRRPYDAASGAEVERRITSEAATPPSVAARGRTFDARGRGLPRDLDTMVLMALRKEPERRYASAGQLADDLDRYLDGRPVAAARDTLGYRTRKFIARHRWGVAAAGALIAMLSAFTVISAFQARRLAAERDTAEGERARAEQVLGALTEMFRVTDPSVTPAGATLPVTDLLRRGQELARREFGDQPDIRARLAHALGRIHAARSEYDQARTLFEEALTTQRALKGDQDATTIEMAHDFAVLIGHMGETARAEGLLQQSLVSQRRLYGDRHERVAQALQDLAAVTASRDAGEQGYREALAMRQEQHAGDNPEVASAMSQLAGHLMGSGKLDEAMPIQRDAVAMLKRTVGERHPRHLLALGELAQLLNQANLLDESEATGRRLLTMQREVFGNQSFQVADTLNTIGVNLATRGQYAAAESNLLESFNVHKSLFGEHHRLTANTARNLGRVYQLQRRYADALTWLTRAADFYERAEGRITQSSLYIRAQAGLVMLRLGRAADSERTLRTVLSGLEARAEEAGPSRLADVRLWLGRTLIESGQAQPAEPLLRLAVAYRDSALGVSHPRAAEARCELARALAGQGRRGEIGNLLATCWPIYQEWGLADPVVIASLRQLVDFTSVR